MSQVNAQQLLIAKEKFQKTYLLLKASVEKIQRYNPDKAYSADELEPYDALSDRFIRTVEIAIKYFRTYEYYLQAEQSQTLRDGLNRMEKLGLVTNTDIWLDMRDLRNRIIHDYVPEKMAEMYQLICKDFYDELSQVDKKINQLSYE